MALLADPKKLRLYNNVLVRAEKESEDTITSNNIILYKNTTFDPHKSKRIFGEIVAVPYKLRPSRVHQTDSMYPIAKTYFPGENISKQVKAYQERIGRRLVVSELKAHKVRYSSSPYFPSFTSNHDQPILASVGDTAWFHYLALSDESYMGQDDDHNRYYQIPYESIFCFTTSSGHTKMANGYVQVDPYWDENYEDIEVDGKLIKGKLKGNLVIGLKEKPEFRTGVVVRKGFDFGEDTRSTVVDGDIIIYDKGSEFANEINGCKVYLMQQWQIIAKRQGNTFIPVGDYVQLRVRKKVQGIILRMEDVIEDKGIVIAKGENCQYVQEGSNYIFNVKARVFNLEDTILIKEGKILARYDI
jgi:co-chaperonin GroES (HSP10)